MIISPFTENDRTATIELWERCGLTAPQNDPGKDIDRKLGKDPQLFLIGKIDGRVMASAMGGYDGHRGWVNYLGVDPDFRQKGYARILMACLEEKLRAMGCPKINLQVRQTNTRVIQFYQAIGFDTDPVVSLGKRLIKD